MLHDLESWNSSCIRSGILRALLYKLLTWHWAGGANEDTWLGRLDVIMEYAPDIILVESAVNDQSNYDEQTSRADHVNRTSSYLLLNMLMNFPSEPAVINVELF